MSATPAFASVARIGFGSVSTANTNRDGTGTIVDLLTGAAAGTRIDRLVLQATGNPADSTVTIFLHDGTAYRLLTEVDIGDPAAASTTLPGYHNEIQTPGLVLPSASWKLAAAITVALTSGAMNVFAYGGDLT